MPSVKEMLKVAVIAIVAVAVAKRLPFTASYL